jgi:hypothetical protein
MPDNRYYPFNLNGKIDPEAATALRMAFQGLKDANDAIANLKAQIGSAAGNASGTASVVSSKTVITNVERTVSAMSIGWITAPTYTLQDTDYAGMHLFKAEGPVAVVLSSAVASPFYTFLQNESAGELTLTPDAGTVNALASITLLPGQATVLFFDGRDWFALIMAVPETVADVQHQWLKSYDSTTGAFTTSQPAAEDLSDGVTGTGSVVRSNGPTLNGPISISSLPVYANNQAAKDGGLGVNRLYRTGGDPDTICIVH